MFNKSQYDHVSRNESLEKTKEVNLEKKTIEEPIDFKSPNRSGFRPYAQFRYNDLENRGEF